MKDSSMCYPFYNYPWDCVLNKNGVIKIGDVLYCFQKDAQIAILDGKVKTLNQFLSKPESFDTTLIKVYSFQKLKSTLPANYGLVANTRTYSSGGGVRWDMALYYDKATVVLKDPYMNDYTVQVGVRYYMYFHEEKKGLFGWRDSHDIFWHKILNYNWGGNYDPYFNKNWTNYTNMTPAIGYMDVNIDPLANAYLDIQVWQFNGALSPYPSSYPGIAPIINNYSCEGYTDYMPAISKLTIN